MLAHQEHKGHGISAAACSGSPASIYGQTANFLQGAAEITHAMSPSFEAGRKRLGGTATVCRKNMSAGAHTDVATGMPESHVLTQKMSDSRCE